MVALVQVLRAGQGGQREVVPNLAKKRQKRSTSHFGRCPDFVLCVRTREVNDISARLAVPVFSW